MKVVFMGFQTWGTVALKVLCQSRHEVVLVFTHPKSGHEYESIWGDSVRDLAEEHGIPVIESLHCNDEESRRAIAETSPDLLLMSNWRTWLSPVTCALARHEAVNIHDALLPRYAGFSPINWAIANGEKKCGVTAHFVNEEYDLGDIILQEEIEIGFRETATDLFHKVIAAIPGLTLATLDLIERGAVCRIPQDRVASTFYHKRSSRDSLVDWTASNLQVYNLVRAQSDPYPNAFTYYRGRKLKIKSASLPNRAYCGTPARIFGRLSDGVVVLCGRPPSGLDQGLLLHRVQEEGGPVVEANAYFDGMGEYFTMSPG